MPYTLYFLPFNSIVGNGRLNCCSMPGNTRCSTSTSRLAKYLYSGPFLLWPIALGTKHTSAHCTPLSSFFPFTTLYIGFQSDSSTSATACLNCGVTSQPIANSITPKSLPPLAQYFNKLC